MCGIFCILRSKNCQCEFVHSSNNLIHELLVNRGPDGQNSIELKDETLHLQFKGTLLWLRGSKPHVQPNEQNGNIFLWNGDLFHTKLPDELSDTEYIAKKLNCSSSRRHVRQVLSNLKGPGAYIYYNAELQKLWFGRDFFGRHSLLADLKSCHMVISSIGCYREKVDLFEIPAYGTYEVDLDEPFRIELIPWENRKNVSIDHRLGAYISISQSEHIQPNINPVISKKPYKGQPYDSIKGYLESDEGSKNVKDLHQVLLKSIEERVLAQPFYCCDCIKEIVIKNFDIKEQDACHHSKVAVLFSGGLDSVVLAYLAAQYIRPGESLDLINVAFPQSDGTYNVPDRLTAFQAFEEMQPLVKAKLNLVLVNVPKAELQEMRELRIKDLLWPLNTVLDDSIGCAIWFASRGRGVLWNEEEADYTSPARVLILGMGADEQLGGYSKHKAAFKGRDRENLLCELQRQLDGISERNLGRDNRIVSDHGIAGRFPYLDENVVEYLCGLPLEAKMNLDLERGIGDKIILRALAFSFGLEKTALEPKRAIQFGSRIAKLENRKEKATDKAVR